MGLALPDPEPTDSKLEPVPTQRGPVSGASQPGHNCDWEESMVVPGSEEGFCDSDEEPIRSPSGSDLRACEVRHNLFRLSRECENELIRIQGSGVRCHGSGLEEGDSNLR